MGRSFLRCMSPLKIRPYRSEDAVWLAERMILFTNNMKGLTRISGLLSVRH
jgi:hypothetical protein